MKLGRKGLVNEKRKILPSKDSGAGGVLASTTGRALPNRHPYLVGRWWVMYRHTREVRAMSIVCSTCAITGNRICLHISVGDREQEGER